VEQRLSVVTLGVADLERARRFYEDGLGWRRGNTHAEVVFFQVGGAVLALFGRDALAADARLPAAGRRFGGITLAYNARSREEVDRVLAEAQAAGATILKPAQDAFWGGYYG
jgi:catechol 2,3-dioxygenase-like lactoylglutathione lyase family enzyme